MPKKTYEQAKQAGKKASLVEQQRANLFTTSVANVAPGERVVVEIEYLEDIRYEDGRFSIRFPMTLTPRYISRPGAARQDRQRLVGRHRSGTGRVAGYADRWSRLRARHRMTLTANINAGMPLETSCQSLSSGQRHRSKAATTA